LCEGGGGGLSDTTECGGGLLGGPPPGGGGGGGAIPHHRFQKGSEAHRASCSTIEGSLPADKAARVSS